MPTSKAWGKAWIDAIYGHLHARGQVHAALDVGAGRGTFSMRLRDAHPGVAWTAVEAWEPYVAEYGLEEKYDRVVVGDARRLAWEALGTFDVVFFGDVLEHMAKPEALALVARALRAARFAFVSVPVTYLPQDDWGGNPYEVHAKPDWSHEEAMASLPGIRAWYVEGFNGVYALASAPVDVDLLLGAVRAAPREAYGPEARSGVSASPRRALWRARHAWRRLRRRLLGMHEQRHRRAAAKLRLLARRAAGKLGARSAGAR